MHKNTENTIVSKGACNTDSNNMYKTVKTPVCPTVHETIDQTACTITGKTRVCPTVHVILDQKTMYENTENASVSNGACNTT